MALKEIYERKRNAYAVWRATLEAAEKENRPLSAEDKAICEKCEADINQCNAEIEDENAKITQSAKLAAVAESMEASEPIRLRINKDDQVIAKTAVLPLGERLRALGDQGIGRREALDLIAKEKSEQAELQSKAFRQYLLSGQINPALRERAALRVDDDAQGGFLVVPERFQAQLIQDIDRMVKVRQFATVITVTDAESLGAPALENDMGDPTWTTELKVGDEDSTLSFNKRVLTPHPVARYIKVSKDLLRKSTLSVEGIVRERLAYKFGTVEETAFMTGSGGSEPLGLFTASAMGISTDRDVSTDNTITTITTDGLINAKYKLESQWLSSPNLRWIFHRDLVAYIRKLKDGNGQYIWSPGLAADRVDTILEVPVVMSEYAPNTMTTGLYVGIIGDLSYFWIVDQLGMQVQRLQELYAMTNQDAFVGRLACDAMPVLENAFARVTMG